MDVSIESLQAGQKGLSVKLFQQRLGPPPVGQLLLQIDWLLSAHLSNLSRIEKYSLENVENKNPWCKNQLTAVTWYLPNIVQTASNRVIFDIS